jgi:hypothetical protein
MNGGEVKRTPSGVDQYGFAALSRLQEIDLVGGLIVQEGATICVCEL